MNGTSAQPQVSRIAVGIATGLGLGYLPIAPGTWGSFGGVGLFLLCDAGTDYFLGTRTGGSASRLGAPGQIPFVTLLLVHLACIGVVAAVGVWAARVGEIHFRRADPGPVVVDEISGQQIALLPLLGAARDSAAWKSILLGFILFRVFDIIKPPPARQAESWRDGWGIMADDWFAGLYAAAIVWVARLLGWV